LAQIKLSQYNISNKSGDILQSFFVLLGDKQLVWQLKWGKKVGDMVRHRAPVP
jgi:hypothetical protein